MADPLEKAAEDYALLAIRTAMVEDRTKKLSQQAASYLDQQAKLNAIVDKTSQEYKDFSTQLGKTWDTMKGLSNDIKQANTLSKQLQSTTKSLTEQYDKLSKNINTSIGHATKWLAVFGAGGFSMQKIRDITIKYNQDVFNLSRTMQVSGKNVGTFTSAVDKATKSTIMSRGQFVDFANSVAQGWKGMAPSIDTIEGMAEALQKQLGPNMDNIKEGMKNLLDVMNKFPALGKTVQKTMSDLAAGKSGAKEKADELKVYMGIQARAGNIDRNTYTGTLKLLTATTSGQEKQVETNRDLLNVSKDLENVMLSMGKTFEKTAATMAQGLSLVLHGLSQTPTMVFSIIAAFKLWEMQMIRMQKLQMMQGGIPGMPMMPGMSGSPATGGGGAGLAGAGVMTAATAVSAMAGGKMTSSGVIKEAVKDGTSGALKEASAAAKPGMGAMGWLTGGLTAVMTGAGEYQERRAAGEGAGRAAEAGGMKGGIAGGATIAGAAIGTAIAGPIGTIVGGMIGQMFGGPIADWITKKVLPPLKDAEKEAADFGKALKPAEDAIAQSNLELMEMRENYDNIIDAANKNVEILKSEADLLNQVAGMNWGNLDKIMGRTVEEIKKSRDASKEFFELFIAGEGTFKALQKAGVNFGKGVTDAMAAASSGGGVGKFMESGFSDAVDAIQKKTEELKKNIEDLGQQKIKTKGAGDEKGVIEIDEKINALIAQRSSLETFMGEMGKNRYTVMKSEADIIDTQRGLINKTAGEAERVNSVYESRLQTERDLMEAAQFGMGASLQMMQKQVDMAYELIKVEQQRLKTQEERVKQQLIDKHLTEDQAKAAVNSIKSSKNAMEAQKMAHSIAVNTTKDENDRKAIERSLLGFAEDQADVGNKIMQQQKKIYDLTKEIREGYLDAIREMGVGAGEFEKIIGTQEMGVTQLMDAVNAYTTTGQQNIMNTMKLGGYQSQQQTAGGVGVGVTGGYVAGGGPMLSFIGGDEMNQRNRRITGYQESMQKYQQMQSGQGGSTVGGALAAGEEGQYIRPYQEEVKIQKEGNKPVVEAINSLRVSDIGWGINPALKAPSYETGTTVGGDERLRSNIGNVVGFGAGLAGQVQPSTPAEGSGFVRGPGDTRSPWATPGTTTGLIRGAKPSPQQAKAIGDLMVKAMKTTFTDQEKEALKYYANSFKDELHKIGSGKTVTKTGIIQLTRSEMNKKAREAAIERMKIERGGFGLTGEEISGAIKKQTLVQKAEPYLKEREEEEKKRTEIEEKKKRREQLITELRQKTVEQVETQKKVEETKRAAEETHKAIQKEISPESQGSILGDIWRGATSWTKPILGGAAALGRKAIASGAERNKELSTFVPEGWSSEDVRADYSKITGMDVEKANRLSGTYGTQQKKQEAMEEKYKQQSDEIAKKQLEISSIDAEMQTATAAAAGAPVASATTAGVAAAAPTSGETPAMKSRREARQEKDKEQAMADALQVRKKKGESEESFQQRKFQEMNRQLTTARDETGKPMTDKMSIEEIKKYQESARKASRLEKGKPGQGVPSPVVMEDTSAMAKGAETAEQRKGLAASEEAQSAYTSAQAQASREGVYGAGAGGAGGAGGTVKIEVYLGPGLSGKVEAAAGMAVQLTEATTSKAP